MFNKSDMQHLDKQYEDLKHQLDTMQDLMVRRFNYAQKDRKAESDKVCEYFDMAFGQGIKGKDNDRLGLIGSGHDIPADTSGGTEVLDQLSKVYSLIFKRNGTDTDDITGGLSNQKDYYRVDVTIDAPNNAINAMLLKHIISPFSCGSLTYNEISTLYSYESWDDLEGGVINKTGSAKGFFYDDSVVGYSTLSFANNDRLISFIKIDNLENKSKTKMKNLTQFEAE